MTLLDQGFSSLSNLLAVFLVAHALDRELFGQFALGYAILIACLAVSRSWFGTRISLVGDRGAVHAEARAVAGSLVVLAVPLVLLVLALGRLLGGASIDALLLVVALATPVVCLQDALRFAAVAGGRPAAALVSDVLWTCGLAALLPLTGRVSGTTVLWMWLGAAAVALLVLLLWLRLLPDVPAGWRALRERHRTSESVSIGTIVTLGASLLVTGVVARLLGDADVGSLRGASTLMGPINVVMAFVNLALTPALVRRGRARDLRFCWLVGLGSLAVTLAWGAVVLLLPDQLGERLLSDSWAGSREVVPFTVLEYCALALATAWTLGLKVRGEAGMLVRQKLVVAVVMVAAGVVGAAVLADVRAVSAGLAVAAATGVLIGWMNLRTSLRRRSGRSPVPEVVSG